MPVWRASAGARPPQEQPPQRTSKPGWPPRRQLGTRSLKRSLPRRQVPEQELARPQQARSASRPPRLPPGAGPAEPVRQDAKAHPRVERAAPALPAGYPQGGAPRAWARRDGARPRAGPARGVADPPRRMGGSGPERPGAVGRPSPRPAVLHATCAGPARERREPARRREGVLQPSGLPGPSARPPPRRGARSSPRSRARSQPRSARPAAGSCCREKRGTPQRPPRTRRPRRSRATGRGGSCEAVRKGRKRRRGRRGAVRLPPPPPLQSLSGHCAYAAARHQRLKQLGLRSHDPNLAVRDLDTLG